MAKAEIMHRQRLLNICHRKTNGTYSRKSKTSHIVDEIEEETYQRRPRPEYLTMTKQETKTILRARFRMLECGINAKGTMSEKCQSCYVLDDENHRLNYCRKFTSTNLFSHDTKVPFEIVFSDDVSVLRNIIPLINRVWNTRNANGTMTKI